MSGMKSFLAIAIITLASSLSIIAQEHTRRPPRTTPRPVSKKALPNNTPDTSGWVSFTSEAGRFSVLMPELPNAEEPKIIESEHGPYTTHLFRARIPGSVFLIGWVDYDPSFDLDRQ